MHTRAQGDFQLSFWTDGKKITEFVGGDEERYCFLSLLEKCQNKRILEKENVSGSSPRLHSQARKQSGVEKRRQPL